MAARRMTPQMLATVAERFKVLAEPARLAILAALQGGELTVSDLVEATEMGQANVSRHLQQLHAHGFVRRRRDGAFVHYALSDDTVFRLCDLMCGRIERDLRERQAGLGA